MFKTSSTRRLIGAVAASAALCAAALPARAEPAMWVVKDADSTIYLFGSVHMLKADTAWESKRLKQALKDATEIWFEVPDPGDQQKAVAEVIPALLAKGLSPGTPLSSRLSPEDFAKVEAAAKTSGLDIRAVDAMRPWLAAVLLSSAPMLKGGYDPKAGVELVLEQQAKAEGDTVRGFETLSQQLSFFADLPEAVQIDYLKSVLDGDGSNTEIDQMADAWSKGDLATLEKGVVEDMRKESPALYQALIAKRNADWAGQIAERLKGSGVSFVAVGAGHLVGPDSLQAQLKKRGIKAKRY